VINENGFTLRADNRVAMSRLLHRVSVARDAQQQIALARACVRLHHAGTAALLRDVVSRIVRDKVSVLVLGARGSGRSTLLRELSAAIAEQLLQVDVVDSNGDIGGDGELPHAALGKARRVTTRAASRTSPDALASTITELASKRPLVAVVDDISTAMQCESLRQLASDGASVVASAMAPSLEALCQRNAHVGALLGYRKAAGGTGKQVTLLTLFGVVIELRAFGEVLVHEQVSASVSVLQGVELKDAGNGEPSMGRCEGAPLVSHAAARRAAAHAQAAQHSACATRSIGSPICRIAMRLFDQKSSQSLPTALRLDDQMSLSKAIGRRRRMRAVATAAPGGAGRLGRRREERGARREGAPGGDKNVHNREKRNEKRDTEQPEKSGISIDRLVLLPPMPHRPHARLWRPRRLRSIFVLSVNINTQQQPAIRVHKLQRRIAQHTLRRDQRQPGGRHVPPPRFCELKLHFD
jgi:energy-coupling factor transporter ATP-binding protein EcfA2